MADAQKTIDLIFNGIDKTGAATMAALDNAKKFTGSVQSITAPIADFTVGAVKLEAGLLAAGLAMTVFAVQKAGEFESAMLDLKKVLTDADGPIEGFADASREMALEFGVASTEVLQSVANFKQAGFTAEEALMLARNALDLKIAGDIDAARASDLLVASMKGFGLEASDAARVVDLLNAVSNEYATDVNQLAEGFAKLSPVAKAAGFSLEETAGILTPGIEVFRSGAEVANAMRTVLLRLQDDSKPVQEALKALGVTQTGVNGELRSARDIYFDVSKVFGTLSDSQKTYYAAQLAGLDQSGKFIAVMDGVGKTMRISGADFKYLGSAAKEVEIRLGSFEIVARRVGVAFDNMFIDIGMPLLDEFGGIAKAMTQIFASIGVSAKEGGLKDLADYIETMMKGVQASIETVAKNLPAALAGADFSGFKGGIDAVVGAFGRLFSNIDLSTVDGLTRAIELAGAAFLGLSKFTAGVIESFKPLFDKLVEIAGKVGTLNPDFFEMAGNIGGAAIQVTKFAEALGGLAPWLEAIVGLMIAKQGVSLVSGVAALSSSIPVLAATVGLWTAGIAAGAAGIGLIVYALNDWIKAEALKNAASDTSLKLTAQTTDRLKEFAAATGITAQSLDEIFKLHKDGVVVWDEASKSYQRAGTAITDSGNSFDKSNKALLDAYAASEKAATGATKLAKSTEEINTYAMKTVPIIDAATGKITGYEQQLVKSAEGTIKLGKASEKTGTDLTKIASETDKAKEATKKWNEEIAKMAFQEKLALIESQTKIATAQIDADAKKAVAAFESIGTAITSTGDVLKGLQSQMSGFDNVSFSTQYKIEAQIEKENKRRDDAFKLQKDLTEAQIAQMKAQTEAMLKGDGLIKIDGAGLQPHLEAFMWEILKTIQVKVNKDGLKMLLGT